MAAQKKGLGRGLSSLLGEALIPVEASPEETGPVAANAAAAGGITQLPVEQLQPGKFQPRQKFDDTGLDELASSIRRQGILQPIVVRQQGEVYEIVAGERRWRAAQRAELHNVPVIIRDFDDSTALEVSILENVQRSDLNPIEEAGGYQRLITEFSYTQEELAQILGKSRPYVANALRLLRLPASVIGHLIDGNLSAGHARTLVGLNEDQAVVAAEAIISQGLSVRQAEKLSKTASGNSETAPDKPLSKPATSAASLDPNLRALEQSLESRLGLNVEVKPGKGEAGTIAFQYSTLDQLDSLLARLR